MMDELNPVWKTLETVRYKREVVFSSIEFTEWHKQELSIECTKMLEQTMAMLRNAGGLIDLILAAMPEDLRAHLYDSLKQRGII